MIEDLRKSINATLYERVSSPFYGTFILTWVIWNWQIIYVTLFVTEKLVGNKIDLITQNYSSLYCLILWPLISTIILLTLFPFVSNGAYYLHIIFKQWRSDKRNQIERKQLLTIEKSLELRDEIRNQEDKLEKLLERKNNEIKLLNQEVDGYRNELEKVKKIEKKSKISISPSKKDFNEEFNEVLSNHLLVREFTIILKRIQGGHKMMTGSNTPSSDAVAFFESNDFIQNKGGTYSFTEKGNSFVKRYAERKKELSKKA